MNRLFSIAIISLIIGGMLTACSDDDELYRNEIGSYLQDDISVCHISRNHLDLGEEPGAIVLLLKSRQDDAVLSIVSDVKLLGESYMFSIPIKDIKQIPDGNYEMSCKTLQGVLYGNRLDVRFQNNMLQCINYVMKTYSLRKGDGTEDNPYIISSAEDFDMLKYELSTDTNKGKGQYFKQTQSFKALAPSYANTNRGYSGEEFAGNYDGGNYTIEYKYIGAGSEDIDKNIGLFSGLRDGANISNLYIVADIGNISNNAGALAGEAKGNVTIKDVYYQTTIYSQSGYNAAKYVGGLIGEVEDASIDIDGSGNKGFSSDFISISGSTDVGGLVGRMLNSKFTLRNIYITHDVSDANNDVAPIYSSSNSAGGLIGAISSPSGECSISSCTVKTSIKAKNDYVGGFVGWGDIDKDLNITDCNMESYVRGDKYVGGFVGIAKNIGILRLTGTNNIRNKNIAGNMSVGGIVGKIDDCKMNINGPTNILFGHNGITANKMYAGGVAGEAYDTQIYVSFVKYNEALTVSSDFCAGGIVGYLSNSTLLSNNYLTYVSGAKRAIPKKDQFDADFNGNVTGRNRIGGAVGFATNSNIKYISVRANVAGTDSIGGIVGAAELTTTTHLIEQCTFDGTVKGNKDIGGICGKFTKDGRIDSSVNYGKIEGNENVGGIAGAANYHDITQTRTFFYACVNTGNVSGTTDVGGVVGYLHGSNGSDYYIHVESCANYGNINGNKSTTGGIVGLIPSIKGRIYRCANHGYVHSSGDSRTGGIIGLMGRDAPPETLGLYVSTNLEIGWCANKGTVSSSGEARVGGIVGYAEEGTIDWEDHDAWIHDCYNEGNISSGNGKAGGIIGYSDRYNYLQALVNYGETDYAIVGDYKYGPDMHDDYTYYTKGKARDYIADTYVETPSDQSKFKGFDFNNTWMMYNNTHPILVSCPFQNVYFSNN